MKNPTRQDVSRVFAQIVPKIMQGIQLDFFIKRSVTQTQFLMLMAIHGYKRCTMGTLSKNMHVSMPTATGVVNRLVAVGYLRRFKEPEDRRQVVVELTVKGEGFISEFQGIIRKRWEDILKALSVNELSLFYKVVDKLNERLSSGIPNER
jgi:MarR family transcriptional regulator, organic hydroperoxide resistance regulator